MTLDDIKALVQFMRSERVIVFEAQGVKVQFDPRPKHETTGAEATQPATKTPSPAKAVFQGMDVGTLLGVNGAEIS